MCDAFLYDVLTYGDIGDVLGKSVVLLVENFKFQQAYTWCFSYDAPTPKFNLTLDTLTPWLDKIVYELGRQQAIFYLCINCRKVLDTKCQRCSLSG